MLNGFCGYKLNYTSFLQESEPESGRTSPSLDDLEVKKKLLLEALSSENSQEDAGSEVGETGEITSKVADIPEPNSDDKTESTQNDDDVASQSKKTTDPVTNNDGATRLAQEEQPISIENMDEDSQETVALVSSTNTQATEEIDTDTEKVEVLITPEHKLKTVRTEYGTPIIGSVTNYTKLPSDDKFAKDICDVINFENLPNSTGKYKQISTLLKKVKDQVDRIQDS